MLAGSKLAQRANWHHPDSNSPFRPIALSPHRAIAPRPCNHRRPERFLATEVKAIDSSLRPFA